MISARQIGARTKNFSFNCSLGLGFKDELWLWLSSGHLLLSGDGLGLGFWLTGDARLEFLRNA